ncbi:MAG TPA: type II secretion system minor pseudopilin GspK, partial [Gammaproteobacteria bacterium]|nr:type II secretion system minor pseudopilin GspK [Gammaproteobacteria bacterium]
MGLNLRKQSGAAIIVALFVVSLVTMSAIAMLERFSRSLRSTELTQAATTAELYAAGSISWAMEQLNENWRKQKPNQVVDRTPITSPENTIDLAKISSTITTADGNFNINNLKNPEYEENFTRLIQIVQPDISIDIAKNITLATQSWIVTGKANLDEYYGKQNPAYQEPHRPMASISELRMVKGVTPELYNALFPYLAALPEVTPININNASVPVLMSLSPTMTKAAADGIIERRKKSPFADTASFLQLDIVKNNPIDEKKISTLSHYFLVKTHVKVTEHDTILYTLLHREIKNAKPFETVLWQSKG